MKKLTRLALRLDTVGERNGSLYMNKLFFEKVDKLLSD